MTHVQQVVDDEHLLAQMMADMSGADALYRPTNYWQFYETVFLPELRRKGLRDFRRRRHSVLESFGATDPLIRGTVTFRNSFRGMNKLSEVIENVLWHNPFLPVKGLTTTKHEWIAAYFWAYVKRKFEQANLVLEDCPMSLVGNPEDVLEIGEKPYSFTYLNYCAMLADAALHIELRDGMTMCELGTGLGRNIEIFAKLFASATLLVVDIPPQLYVSHQYLRSVFPDRVISYSDAIRLEPELLADQRELVRGKIIMLPTWSLPKWSNFKIDLFWNSASFHEMEPDVVTNYLRLVQHMAPSHVYINAIPAGNYWGTWKPGRGGTKLPVTGGQYLEALRHQYRLKASYDTDYFLRINDHTSYIFERRAELQPDRKADLSDPQR